MVPGELPYAIPRVRQWKHAALQRFLTMDDLACVLISSEERKPKELRDRPLLLLLARLGLRAGEIVRLELDDIDWRAGTSWFARGRPDESNSCLFPRMSGLRWLPI